jgi:hypothetical protein
MAIDVSKDPANSIIGVKMEAAEYSERSLPTRLHGATFLKTIIYIFMAVRTSNLIYFKEFM